MVEAVTVWESRVGTGLACEAFGVSARSWRHRAQVDRGEVPARASRAAEGPRRPHPAKLTTVEEDRVVELLCSERFCDVGVAEAWATLLDEGVYLCSLRTMHRILADRDLSGQRRQGPARDRATMGVGPVGVTASG